MFFCKTEVLLHPFRSELLCRRGLLRVILRLLLLRLLLLLLLIWRLRGSRLLLFFLPQRPLQNVVPVRFIVLLLGSASLWLALWLGLALLRLSLLRRRRRLLLLLFPAP